MKWQVLDFSSSKGKRNCQTFLQVIQKVKSFTQNDYQINRRKRSSTRSSYLLPTGACGFTIFNKDDLEKPFVPWKENKERGLCQTPHFRFLLKLGSVSASCFSSHLQIQERLIVADCITAVAKLWWPQCGKQIFPGELEKKSVVFLFGLLPFFKKKTICNWFRS